MTRFLRPAIRGMAGYTPGEQPAADADVIKLNTNENPYPPSPRVLAALQEALAGGERLRKYPDPAGCAFRRTAGRILGVDPDRILIGNGSDDILTIVTRAFVPEGGLVVAPTPSYLLYKTLAEIQGAKFQAVPFTQTWGLPNPWPATSAHLTLVPNPNSPTGTFVAVEELERLAGQLNGPLVVDEAYVDFADNHALALSRLPNVLVTRTFSKSYALAGLRFGFAVAGPELIGELVKVKDSYNCDALSLLGATAALEDQEYLQATRGRIRLTRARLEKTLRQLGFEVPPSQANFVWCRRAAGSVKPIFEELKRRKILVRYMFYDGYGEGLRISIGTDAEIDRLLEELKGLVQEPGMIILPQVVGLTLCDRIDVDAQTGQYSLVGLFHSRHFRHYPSPPQRFSAYVALYDGFGEGTIELVISQVGLDLDVYSYRRWLAFSARLQMIHLEINVTKCIFPEPGRYLLALRFDKQNLAARYLDLISG